MLLFEIIAAVWLFVFGSVIGSFMNVLVHRTPRGESIIGPSRCPRCTAAIRFRDNIPIFGWFLLRGRCRDCGLPISFRYPVVEFVTACIFLVLGLAELYTGGANMPHRAADQTAGFAGVIADTNWPLVRIYALHCVLVSTLFCWALMRVDEKAIPRVQMWAMWIFGFAMVTIWPDIQPLHWTGDVSVHSRDFTHVDGFRNGVFGFLAGGGIALAWMLMRGKREDKHNSAASAAALTSIGVLLGWQAVVSILFITALSRALTAVSSFRSARRQVPLLMDMMVATVVQLCFWQQLWHLSSWPGAGRWYTNIGGAIIAVIVLLGTEWRGHEPDANE